MRSKYGEYPEYHTSLDDLSFSTPSWLKGGYTALQKAIEIIEQNVYLKTTMLCERQLGKRGLYPTLSTKHPSQSTRTMMNLISYCDGQHSLLEIAELIKEPFWDLLPMVKTLQENELVGYINV